MSVETYIETMNSFIVFLLTNRSNLKRKRSSVMPYKFTLTVLAFLVSHSAAQAQVLKSSLQDLVFSSPRVQAAQADEQAAIERVDETFRRNWFPQLDLSLEGGVQGYRTTNQPDAGSNNVTRSSAKITQLVYDFGKSGSQISETQALARQAALTAMSTIEGVLLESTTAHWSVLRARQVLEFANRSERSVRNQTQQETSMVDLGKGYESNVLQAKVQLAGAESRRIRAEGALQIADSRMVALFGANANKIPYSEIAIANPSAIPNTYAEAEAIALESNKQLQIGAARTMVLNHRIDSVRTREYMPRLQFSSEMARREGMDGLPGWVNDQKHMLTLTYGLNTGLAGRTAIAAAVKDSMASKSREEDTRALVIEQVSIAWRNLSIARANQTILSNQVAIATKFLEMANAERKLGRRSLLDILTAEISVINAQSDLATTQADVGIAGLTLLQAIGRLKIENVKFVPAPL